LQFDPGLNIQPTILPDPCPIDVLGEVDAIEFAILCSSPPISPAPVVGVQINTSAGVEPICSELHKKQVELSGK
jgi:hypothetical protein